VTAVGLTDLARPHTLSAALKTTEGFGWGLGLSLRGDHVRLLPVR